MSKECRTIHQLFNGLPVFNFPFDKSLLPANGIYILFEKGELAHSAKRIVRAGTHTGKNQLPSRLCQHFLTANKDRSIFRKNIGRALLNKRQDSFLAKWEIDLTSRLAKEKHLDLVNSRRQKQIEQAVTKHIQDHFSFVVIPVENKTQRLALESKIISTISLCDECQPSAKWLGRFSPKEKIRANGLWLVNELNKKPLTSTEIKELISTTQWVEPLKKQS